MSLLHALVLLSTLTVTVCAQGPVLHPLGREMLPPIQTTLPLHFFDMDADGDLDLFVVGHHADRLFRNGGIGDLIEVSNQLPVLTTEPRSLAVASGDVDGDGDIDLVVAGRQQTRLYLNNGTGRFADVTATQMPIDTVVTAACALVDLDGDADLDLVLANGDDFSGAQQNSIYVNNGAGRFTDVTGAQAPRRSERSPYLAHGDLDGDGDIDLLFDGDGRISERALWTNNGTGTFVLNTAAMPTTFVGGRGILLFDVDLDGALDILFGESLQLLRNRGAGLFGDETGRWISISSLRQITLTDLDRDGVRDLVGLNRDGRLLVLEGPSQFKPWINQPLPQPAEEPIRAFHLPDLDGDRYPDLVAVHGDYASELWMNVTTDRFGVVRRFASQRLPNFRELVLSSVSHVADFDGDGFADIYRPRIATAAPLIDALLLGDGAGRFKSAPAGTMPALSQHPGVVRTADVNRDGRLDLFVSAAGSGDVLLQDRLYLGSAYGQWIEVTLSHLPLRTQRKITTSDAEWHDYTGDGWVDLLVTDTNGTQLLKNDGQGRLQPFGPVIKEHSVVSGDADADGDLDLVVRSATGMSLLLNDGFGSFVLATGNRFPALPELFEPLPFDFDGDGDDDLLVVSGYISPTNYVLRNQGGTWAVVPGAIAATVPGLTYAEAVDLDLDGDLDLVGIDVMTAGGQRFFVLLGNGAGSFTDATAAWLGGAVPADFFLRVHDFDDDGDAELFAESGILWNRTVHAHAPQMARIGRAWHLDLSHEPGTLGPANVALPLLGFRGLDLALPGLGTLRVDPSQAVLGTPIVLPSPAGIVRATLSLPNDNRLLGQSLFAQVLFGTQRGAGPLVWRFSNVVREELVW